MDIPVSLPRPRLVETLDGMQAGSIVFLIAGAGYGKSTLLRQWRDASTVRAVLLPLTTDDQDADVLTRNLARELVHVVPPEDAPSLDASLTPADLEAAIHDLLGRLHALVMFDDLHLVLGTPAEDVISRLLRHDTPHVVFGFASRRCPGFSEPSVALRGRTRWFWQDDLALRSANVRSLCKHWPAFDPDDWLDKTGGWPVSLPVALVNVEPGLPPDRPVLLALREYFTHEVLAALDPDDIEFLEAIAVSQPCRAGDLDTLRGTTDSYQRVAALKCHPIPLVSVTDDVVSMRGFLVNSLTERMRLDNPDRLATYACRVARHLVSSSDAAKAFDLVKDVLSPDDLEAFVYHHGLQLIMRRQSDEVVAWLDQFDYEDMVERPGLLILQMFLAASQTDLGSFTHWRTMVRHSERPDAVPWTPGDPRLRHLIDEALGLSPHRRVLVQALEARGPWSLLARSRVAFDHAIAGRFDEADELLGSLMPLSRSLPLIERWTTFTYTFVRARRGEVEKGWKRLSEQLFVASYLGSENRPAAAMGAALDAWYLARCQPGAQARSAQRTAMRLAASFTSGPQDLRLITLLFLAETAEFLDRDADMAEAMRLIGDIGIPDDGSWLAQELSTLTLRFGQRDNVLTASQLKVLRALETPYPIPKIAADMYLSPATVRSHTRAIYAKLGATSRAEAVDKARDLGLL